MTAFVLLFTMTDMDYVKKGLDLGFTSVMYDGSELSKGENYANTAIMVEAAARYGASVSIRSLSIGTAFAVSTVLTLFLYVKGPAKDI